MAEINIQSNFLKAKVNVFDGDVATIKSEGVLEESNLRDEKGNKKMLYNFQVELANGEIKTGSFNNASLKRFVSAWGRDMENWIDRKIKAEIVKTQAFGKITDSIQWTPVEE